MGSPVSINGLGWAMARGLTGELNVSDVFWGGNCAKSPRDIHFPSSPLRLLRERADRSRLGVRGERGVYFFCCGRFKSGDFGWLRGLFTHTNERKTNKRTNKRTNVYAYALSLTLFPINRENAIHQLPQGRRGNLFPATWRSSRQ
ncbi:MAG: hypothetical protein ACTS6P_01815 [Candidatus Hodgkinia cicadicola]